MVQVVEPGMNGEWKTELLRPEVQAILPFLEKLTLQPDDVGTADVQALRDAGLSDDAIRDAIYVCATFNMIDRVADAFGFDIPPPNHVRAASKFLLAKGYGG
jgi:alkylhydroperoxidase family enzyme